MYMTCAAFFARHRPVSTRAKPACMNMTRKPATSVQAVFRPRAVEVSVTAPKPLRASAGGASAAAGVSGVTPDAEPGAGGGATSAWARTWAARPPIRAANSRQASSFGPRGTRLGRKSMFPSE